MPNLYSIIDRNIIFPIAEIFNKSSILYEYKKLMTSDWYSKDMLQELQRKKLQALIKHCYHNVPFYNKIFNDLSLRPDDIQNVEDLCKLPILTKQIIRNNYEQIISIDAYKRITKNHSTGGSTGTPLQFKTDVRHWSSQWAAILRSWSWYGFNLGEKIFTLGGHSLVKEKKSLNKNDIFDRYMMRNFKYSSSNMKEEDLRFYYRSLMRLHPKAIRGYGSSIFVLANYIYDNQLSIPNLKLIITTGEVLLPTYRNKIQEVFHVPIYNNYGAGDGGISSFECYMHEGLHISEEKCIIEICDAEGKSLPEGEFGHVITTDLENYAFPFIRYDVGDMSYIKRNFCSCGRKSKLFGEVLGRSGKLLYSKDGIPISPTILPILLYPDLDYNKLENQILYNKIDRYQFMQDKLGNITILLKMKDNKDNIKSNYNYIIDNFKNTFIGSKITLNFVSEIHNLPSGKEDYVISEFNIDKNKL